MLVGGYYLTSAALARFTEFFPVRSDRTPPDATMRMAQTSIQITHPPNYYYAL